MPETGSRTLDTRRPNIITVTVEHQGRRLDNFVSMLLAGLPRSRIYRLIRTGEVRVNKGRSKPGYRIKTDDQVRLPPVRLEESAPLPALSERDREQLSAAIIHQDEHLLIVDKPYGMPVHAGSGYDSGLIERLRLLRTEEDDYLELVHRLDRETSGCLLIARRPSVQRKLGNLLRFRNMDKTYLALLSGRWRRGECCIDKPLLRDVLRGGERMVIVSPEGKPSQTLFQPLDCGHNASLMRVKPLTGRTHQIRVHAASLGHALVGDRKYGQQAVNRHFRDAGIRRLCLHAASLGFEHPVTGAYIEASAPMPAELAERIEALL